MTSQKTPIEENLTEGEIVELCAKALNYLQAPKKAEFDGLVKELRRSETAGNFVIETVTKLFEKQRRSLLRAKATGARTRIDPAYALHCMTLISMFAARRQRTPQRDKLIKKLKEKASTIHALFLELGIICENTAQVVKNSHSFTQAAAGLAYRSIHEGITRAQDLKNLAALKAGIKDNPQRKLEKPLTAFENNYINEAGKSHGKQIEVYAAGDTRRYCCTSNDNFIEVTFGDINRACHRRPNTKKILNFLLMKINEQVFHNNELSRNYITFNLKELTEEYKIFDNIRSARTAFFAAVDTLSDIKIKGYITKGKKRIEQSIAVLFPYGDIKNGVCTVGINERVNWQQFILDTFTPLPEAYWKLSGAAADLLHYLFLQARQNCGKIASDGTFNVGIRAIQAHLDLPSENDNTRPAQTIRAPIEKAIEDIETACRGEGFTIEPMLKSGGDIVNCKTSEFLNGYLKISITGEYKAHFENLYKKNHKNKQSSVNGAAKCAHFLQPGEKNG